MPIDATTAAAKIAKARIYRVSREPMTADADSEKLSLRRAPKSSSLLVSSVVVPAANGHEPPAPPHERETFAPRAGPKHDLALAPASLGTLGAPAQSIHDRLMDKSRFHAPIEATCPALARDARRLF